jgi:HEAT repeat protein
MSDKRGDAGRRKTVERQKAGSATVRSLIAELSSRSGIARERARIALVAKGGSALAPLVKALADRDRQVRWEAAKALGEIADPAAAPALVRALKDRTFGVRWLAAEGLIALGPGGLVPLLHALVKNPDSAWLRQGAHHILHDLHRGRRLPARYREATEPVLAALDHVEAHLTAPPAAESALEALGRAAKR